MLIYLTCDLSVHILEVLSPVNAASRNSNSAKIVFCFSGSQAWRGGEGKVSWSRKLLLHTCHKYPVVCDIQMLRMNLVLASTSLTLGECVYVKIRSAAQKQCSRRQLYGKFCNLPQFIQFSCRPDSSVKYAKHRKSIIMKQFMRLILYVILDLFIQGGGAGTGLLWAAQVKFKWELSPYCIFCKFDANKTFRSDSASSVNTIMPAETNGGGGNGGNGAPRASLLCRPNSHPFQVIF